MKKISWDEFIDSIDNSGMIKIITDYEQLQKDSHIGECYLRSKAEEWERIIEYSNVVLIMRDLAFEAYKRFAMRYFVDALLHFKDE